jgi:hypothetical protein
MLHIRGKVLIAGAMTALALMLAAMLAPEQFNAIQSAAAGTPAMHCSHSAYSITGSPRMLASASATTDLRCLKLVRNVSVSKLTFYKNHKWVLAPRYKKWWHVPSPKRRIIALKARTEVRLYTAVLNRVEARITELSGPAWCSGLIGNRALGCRMAFKIWPSEAEWNALDALWQRESSWNTHADNPTSDACGIPQILNNCAHGYDPVVQIRDGINYIQGRSDERTPIGALSHSNRYHWY